MSIPPPESSTEATSPAPEKGRVRPSVWVSTTYFTEGLPYMVVRFMSAVWFTDLGLREALIGYLNWLGVPWNLKFLWAPFLDLYGRKRNWLLGVQGLVTALIILLGVLAFFNKSSGPPVMLVVGILVVLAFSAATHDIAIDGYYLEALPDKRDQAAYTGLRVMAYRIAVIFAKFALIALPFWWMGFGLAGLVMAGLLAFHIWALPRPRPQADEARALLSFKKAFVSYFQRERAAVTLLFIALYKLGDEMLFSMNSPFLLRELSVTKVQLAWLSGLLGTFSTIVGTMVGAWWVKRVGLKRAVWPMTLIMNLTILAYVYLAVKTPQATSASGLAIIAGIHAYENLAAGLGTACLIVFIMYTCKEEYQAAHFAVGTAVMSIGGTVIGGLGGVIVESVGYTWLFLLSFMGSIPSMALLFWVPVEDGSASGEGSG